MAAFLLKAVSTQYLLNGFLCSHDVGCFVLVLSLVCFSFEGVGPISIFDLVFICVLLSCVYNCVY